VSTSKRKKGEGEKGETHQPEKKTAKVPKKWSTPELRGRGDPIQAEAQKKANLPPI
jgi:hypothetical protein